VATGRLIEKEKGKDTLNVGSGGDGTVDVASQLWLSTAPTGMESIIPPENSLII